MKRLRGLVAILILWLFAFYNIERLSAPINLTTVAYLMVPVMAIATILASRLSRVQLWGLLVTSIPVFVLLKAAVGSRVLGAALPVTVTEIVALCITTALARQVSVAILEFERAVTHITIGHVDGWGVSTSIGESEIYREVRRARKHNRPLSLLAVNVDEKTFKVAIDRMVQQAQQTMMRQYVMSGVSRALCDEIDDYNTIAQSNGHFLVLLPEVTPDALPSVIERLQAAVRERVGVKLVVGAASLPEDGVTFEGLTKRAIDGMAVASRATAPAPSSALQSLLTSSLLPEKRNGQADHQSV